jgi:hypothetical protein
LQPYYAIEVIKSGQNYKMLPDKMGIARKYILAQAYFLNYQDDECIKLLDGDYSPQSDDVKSMIFWRQKNWASQS